MKFLIFINTPDEFEWASKMAAKHSSKNVEWYFLRLDENQSLSALEFDAEKMFNNLSIRDLQLNEEKVWKQSKKLQDEMHQHLISHLWKGYDIILKEYIDVLIFHTIYTESIIQASIDQIQPDRVFIPPVWTSIYRSSAQRAFGKLQWIKSFQYIVARVCNERAINCKNHWSLTVNSCINPIRVLAGKILGIIVGLLYDTIRIFYWLKNLISSFIFRLNKKPFPSNSIVVANYDADLHRQFILKTISPKLQSKLLLWIGTAQMGYFAPPEWRQYNFNEYADKLEAADNIGLRIAAAEVFPYLATPQIFQYMKRWYCAALPRKKPPEISLFLWRIISSSEAADERLSNWNRIIDTVKRICFVQDLFSVFNPQLLIVSDTIDSHKHIAIAGYLSEIGVLATSHAIDISNEYVTESYPLGKVNCVFGNKSPHLKNLRLPNLRSEKIVYYDSEIFDNHLSSQEKIDNRKNPTVMIVTSLYTFTTSTLGIHLFINWEIYLKSLSNLVEKLLTLNPLLKVIIKSHPLDDAYELYGQIKDLYPKNVSQWREPLNSDQQILADVVLFYNCLSTLFFTIKAQNIPIVASHGALTKLGLQLIPTAELLSSKDDTKVASYIQEIIENKEGHIAQEAKYCAEALFNSFVEKSCGSLETAITKVIDI